MPELTPEQAIEKLRALPEDRQRLVLQRLSPEVRAGILKTLTAPSSSSVPVPAHPAKQSFWDHVRQNVGQMWTDARTYYPSRTTVMERIPGTNREVTTHEVYGAHNVDAAFLNTLMSVPEFAKQVGTDYIEASRGRENPTEFFNDFNPMEMVHGLYRQFQNDWSQDKGLAVQKLMGSLAGLGLTAAVTHGATEAADSGLSRVGDLRRAGAERMRTAGQDVFGAGEDFKKGKAQEYAGKAAKVREAKNTLNEHEILNKEIAEHSAALDAKIQTAEKNAKAENDAAWETWRKKVAGAEVDPSSVVDAIKAQRPSMDPEDVSEFRKVLKESRPSGAEASQLQTTRDAIARDNKMGSSYEDATPQNRKAIDEIVSRLGLDADEAPEVKQIGADRLHVWKTQLEYAIRKAGRGNVRYALGQVLDKVRELEDQMSEKAGAGAELKHARALHQQFAETFRDTNREPSTAARRSLQETSPEYAKEKGQAERLNKLAKYDPTIKDTAEDIRSRRERLGDLESKKQATKVAKTGVKAPDLTAETRAQIEKNLKKYGRVGTWVARLLIGSGVGALTHGNLSEFSHGILVGEGGLQVISRILRRDSVLDWMSKPTPETIKAIESVPPEDAAKLREALTGLAQEEIRRNPARRGVKLAPAVAAFLGYSSVPVSPVANNRKEVIASKPVVTQ